MSLKSFHIVFISLSAVLAIGSAVYALTAVDGAMSYAWAGLSVAASAFLVWYGRRFLDKMKKLEAAA